MATRSNALSEIARFWLQECHGLLLREAVPVKVKGNYSDIDFVVTSPTGPVSLLDRITFKNAIVETKDERDFEPHGTDFAKRLRNDYMLIQGSRMISAETSCCFSMLQKRHHVVAENIFGQGAEFSKIFIFHALNRIGLEDILAELRDQTRQTSIGIEEYIWCTAKDNRVVGNRPKTSWCIAKNRGYSQGYRIDYCENILIISHI